jgi:hypothetical protein
MGSMLFTDCSSVVAKFSSSFKFQYSPLGRDTPAQYKQYKYRRGKARPRVVAKL